MDYIKEFNKNLNYYLNNHNIIQDNYDYELSTEDNLQIVGKPKQQINLSKIQNNLSIKYTINPTFKVEIPFKINNFLTLIDKIKNCINQDQPEQCLNELKTTNTFSYTKEGNYFNIEIPTTKNLYTNKIINLKFKLINPLLKESV